MGCLNSVFLELSMGARNVEIMVGLMALTTYPAFANLINGLKTSFSVKARSIHKKITTFAVKQRK